MVSFILLIVGNQGCASSILLPIQASRTWVAFLSVAMLMPRGRGGHLDGFVVFGLVFLCVFLCLLG